MRGARWRVEAPRPVIESAPGPEEEAQLDLYLQQQLEEDVARIFDESIYSDLEVVCGKLKILTHSCILKTRTNTFYQKLNSILNHTIIDRDSYDEIYSFISDAYTECKIEEQEKEILKYLNKSFEQTNSSIPTDLKSPDDHDLFSTPKCLTPNCQNTAESSITGSPSTELTKEYYALVPIDGNILDKELLEQDALSTALQSLNQPNTDETETKPLNSKPTSLHLNSSHIPKTVKHSSSCDILNKNYTESYTLDSNRNLLTSLSNSNQASNPREHQGIFEKSSDQGYTPDSLITDEPSSASDYLSAANPFSPVASFSGGFVQFNALSYNNSVKMEDKTSLDSGIERGDPSDPVNHASNRDVTRTDISLTESTLQDLSMDETQEASSGAYSNEPLVPQRVSVNTESVTSSEDSHARMHPSTTHADTGPTKEKKRNNVVQESSSLSSETGSWEHVFPRKLPEEDLSKINTNGENQQSEGHIKYYDTPLVMEQETQTPVQTFQFVSPLVTATPCLIDATKFMIASVHAQVNTQIVEAPSKPVPCSKASVNVNLDDNSEDNETDDSLEQTDENKDPDSIQKDLSPTIFDMTPITEDSLCTNAFEAAAHAEENRRNMEIELERQISGHDTKHATSNEENSLAPTQQFVLASTPHNSILTIKQNSMNPYESDESVNETVINTESSSTSKLAKYNKSSPIVPGSTSIEGNLHQNSSDSECPGVQCGINVNNLPFRYGVYIPSVAKHEVAAKPASFPSPAWVVDMSKKQPDSGNTSSSGTVVTKPRDKQCDNLINESRPDTYENGNRSRSSVDSDCSEKSSHKFYIDLSSLPDPKPPKNNENDQKERNNMFSMYIRLDENKATRKEMPARLSSSLNAKKSSDKNDDQKINSNNEASTASAIHTMNANRKQASCAFEKYESLCNNPNITLNDIMKLPKQVDIETGMEYPASFTNPTQAQLQHGTNNVKEDPPLPADSYGHCLALQRKRQLARGNTAQSRHSECLALMHDEEGEINREADDIAVRAAEESSRRIQESNKPFVRLSDLDMVFGDPPAPKSNRRNDNNKVSDVRMTRSIPENSWGEPSTAASHPIEVISSFHSENAVSLNRLFPQLRNDFSRSMPGYLSNRTRSPLRLPEMLQFNGDSESEASSAQSSMCPSIVGNSTTEENSQTSSLIGNCQSRLGQDLLRMFLEEIAPDVVVQVGGRRIKAHKCILSSRCQYFAGILSGGWVESSGNVIVLPDRFSYNVVYFALCHIYSGVSTIPDSISIMELATIADMLGLEGLKEAIMFTLKAKYCHHFHKPCQVCVAGVLECFPLTSVYGLDELYHRCLKWITKHFAKVWATRAFATLPQELLDKCLMQLINTLTMETFVNVTYGAGLTLLYLETAGRWSDTVVRLCRRLENGCASYAAPRLAEVFRALASFPHDPPQDPPLAALNKLRAVLAAAIEWAPPESACRAYAFLNAIVSEMRVQHQARPDLIRQNRMPQRDLLETYARPWLQHVEAAIVRAAPRVVGTQGYNNLPPELRRRLRDLGCFRYGSHPSSARSAAPPRNTRPTNNGATAIDMDRVRACFVPYASRPPAASTTSRDIIKIHNDLRTKLILGHRPQMRTTKAQEERAKFNSSKNNSSQERLSNKVQRPYDNTKPRYLEPRAQKENVNKKLTSSARNRLVVPKMFSSSESSRNSSPVQMRQIRSSRGLVRNPPGVRAAALSQDSLSDAPRPLTAEPSTDSQASDSQASNKYATYTKAKHAVKPGQPKPKLQSSQEVIKKANTKIPVYLSPGVKNTNSAGSKHKKDKAESDQTAKVDNVATSMASLRKGRVPGSLFSATKSSSAKMVPKVTKEPIIPRQTKRQHQSRRDTDQHHQPAPLMERSGTFLKDEPTFGDQTTRLDIDTETE